MDLKQLKKKYGEKKINEVEKEVRESNELSLEARKTAIFALRYLEATVRYKENKVYGKSSFKNYLLGQFNIREATYRESLRAFTKFEEPTKKYGVGLIAKVSRECGAAKETQVIKEIVEKDKSLKTPIQKDQINQIIAKHAKPKSQYKSYQALYNESQRDIERYKTIISDQKALIAEQAEQIERLKATVTELRAMKAAIMPFMGNEKAVEQRVQ